MNTITLEMLQPFCGEDKTRPAMMRPFPQNGFTFATCGRCLVRVPLIDGTPSIDETIPAPPTVTEKALPIPPEDVEWGTFSTLPEPEMEGCHICAGYGKCACCEVCGTHECGNCDGTGQTEKRLRVVIEHRTFDAKYLRKISMLPGLLIAAKFGSELEPMAFKFDGGIGSVMPMRVQK